jgi:hypothetical protein
MTESYKILGKWFLSTIKQFNDIVFLYEYDEKHKIHYIAVEPYDKFANDDNYCKLENEIFNRLSEQYTDETFLFGENEFNFKVSNACEIFSFNSFYKNYCFPIKYIDNNDYKNMPIMNFHVDGQISLKKGYTTWEA